MASIAKRNGRWLAGYRDETGRERSKMFDRKTDGQRWLDEITTALVTGTYVDPRAGRVTFGEYATSWLTTRVLRPTSLANYEATLRLNVFPRIGGRQMSSIRPSEIESLVTWMSTDTPDHAALKPATVRMAMAVTSSVFKSAVRDRKIPSNPCVGVKLPEVEHRQVVPLTTEKVMDVLAATPPEWRSAVVLGAGAGLRQGEAFGLTVDRIDFLRRTLRVDRQLLTLPRREPLLAPPKSRSSVRTIPLPQTVVEALSAHLARFDTYSDGLLFKPMFRSAFSAKVWVPARTAAGFGPDVTFHSLRHYYASLLIRHGESVKTVQARLGHASAVETLNVYSHLWHDADDRTREAVDSALGAPAEQWRNAHVAVV
jgi:integrase